MTLTQKIILIALLVLGALCLIVGLTLSHYIGGFMRTVEEEAEAQKRELEAEAQARDKADDSGENNTPADRSSL